MAELQAHWEWLRHLRGQQHWTWERFFDVAGSQHWLLVSVVGVLAVGFRKLKQRAKEGLAAGWPVSDATILSATVKSSEGHWVMVEYRYYVRDIYRYGKFSRHFRRKAEAEAFAAAVGHLHVPAHYRTENPDLSVLIERDLRFSGQAAGTLEPR